MRPSIDVAGAVRAREIGSAASGSCTLVVDNPLNDSQSTKEDCDGIFAIQPEGSNAATTLESFVVTESWRLNVSYDFHDISIWNCSDLGAQCFRLNFESSN